MTTAMVAVPQYSPWADDETLWDFDLNVGQRVEIVGFVIKETWLGARLHAIIVHPKTASFAEVPAYFLVPDTAAVPA